MSCVNHKTSSCFVDSAGLCFYCGRPMNFDYWLSAIGPNAYMNPHLYVDEWNLLVANSRNQDNHTGPT